MEFWIGLNSLGKQAKFCSLPDWKWDQPNGSTISKINSVDDESIYVRSAGIGKELSRKKVEAP